ncbi:hypothetical protein DOY81_007288, partial [Sarcophaga bullata]
FKLSQSSLPAANKYLSLMDSIIKIFGKCPFVVATACIWNMHPYSESLSKSREDLVTASKLASQIALASYKHQRHGSSPNLYQDQTDNIRR